LWQQPGTRGKNFLCDPDVTGEKLKCVSGMSAGTYAELMVSFSMILFQYLERPKNPSLEGNMYRLCACCDMGLDFLCCHLWLLVDIRKVSLNQKKDQQNEKRKTQKRR
jgi:hypothetical protein